ncbi:MAG: hypothetical protein ACRC6V_10005 [Bacteroidales bacterium]
MSHSRAKLILEERDDDEKPHNSSKGKGMLLETPYKPGFIDDKDLEAVKMAVDKELSGISNAFYQSTEQTAGTITRIEKLEITGGDQYGELKAEISRVDKVSIAGDRALAESVETLKASVNNEFGEVKGQITETNRVVAEGDKLLAEKIEAITGSFEGDLGGLFGVIEEVKQLSITGDQALAKHSEEMAVEFRAADATLKAGIKTEEEARVTADEALAKRIVTVSADWTNANAELEKKFEGEIDEERVKRELAQAVMDGKITAEEAARIFQDEDLLRKLIQEKLDREAGDKEGIEQIKIVKAAVVSESEARANEDEALARQIDTVSAEYKLADRQLGDALKESVVELKASIRTESLARADADSALASQITVIEAGYIAGDKTTGDKIDKNLVETNAAISAEAVARADADGALGKRVDSVTASYQSADKNITNTFQGKIDKEIVDRELAIAVAEGKITQEQADRIKDDEELLRQLIQEKKDRENGDKNNANEIIKANAAIKTESTARADADKALASQITTVSAEWKKGDEAVLGSFKGDIDAERVARELAIAVAEGKITQEQADRIAKDEDLLRDLIQEKLDRENGDKVNANNITKANAAITSESTARADADGALGKRIDSVTASYQTADKNLTNTFNGKIDQEAVDRALAIAVAEGKITAEQAARIKEDEALLRNLIQEKKDRENGDSENANAIVKANAAITTESTARADADKALASQITTVNAEWKKGDSAVIGTFNGKIDQERVARELAIGVAEGKITQEQADRIAKDEVLLRDLIQEQKDRLNGDKVNSDAINVVKSSVSTESTARADADKALASQINTVNAEWKKGDSTLLGTFTGKIDKERVDRELAISVAEGKITQEQADRIKKDEALLRDLIKEQQDRANGDKTNSDAITVVKASVTTESNARAEQDRALANQITSVNSSLNGSIASVQQTLQTNINAVDGKVNQVNAKWGISVDAGGNIAGIQLNSSSTAGTEFRVLADRMVFTNGSTKIKPISIEGAYAVFNNIIVRDNCIVQGTIYANKLQGNVSNAVALNTSADQSYNFAAAPRDRTVLISGINAQCAGGGGSGSCRITLNTWVNGAHGSSYHESRGNASGWKSLGRTAFVPANVAFSVRVQSVKTTSGGGSGNVDMAGSFIMVV